MQMVMSNLMCDQKSFILRGLVIHDMNQTRRTFENSQNTVGERRAWGETIEFQVVNRKCRSYYRGSSLVTIGAGYGTLATGASLATNINPGVHRHSLLSQNFLRSGVMLLSRIMSS